MGVFIKGMKMPLSCWHSCTLKKVTIMGNVYCPLINKYMEKGEIGVRHPDCPLVEVKEPHGNLVDLDQMVNDYWDSHSMVIGDKELDEIEVIVKEEGSEA